MARAGARMRLQGDKELRRLLRQTPPEVLSRAVAPSTRRAMAPVAKDAKKRLTSFRLKDRSGLLRKSIGVRSKRYRKSGNVWIGVGPRTGFRQTVTTRTGRTMLRNPVKYAHLIERGFHHRYGMRVRARSFLGAAMQAHQGRIVRQLIAELGIQIPKIAARLAVKNSK